MSVEFSDHNPPAPKRPTAETPGAAPAESKEQNADPLKDVGKEANALDRSGKHAMLEQLAAALKEQEKDLSPATRARIFNPDGSVNFANVGQIYGLNENFGRHLTPDGKIRPIAEVPDEQEEKNTDQESNKSGKIPEREPGGKYKGGKELLKDWGLNRDMNGFQEELTERIIAEIRKGNVPDACRNMHTVTMTGPDGTKVSFQTSAGYLAIGTNDDNVRVPLSGPMAKRIADEFGWVLPTATMSQETDKAADIRLAIGGETHNQQDLAHMADLEYAVRHNERAKAELEKYRLQYNERAQREHRPQLSTADLSKMLIRGEKKNIFTGQGATRGGIGIGGLLDARGNPIQPYQYPHSAERGPHGESGYHGDYSQDIAIYDPMVQITKPSGQTSTVHLYDALRDPEYARILNASEANQNSGTFDATASYMPTTGTPTPDTRLARRTGTTGSGRTSRTA